MIIENTGNYMIATDGLGYSIKHVGNRKEVYLQGEDATKLREDLDKMLTDKQIDAICCDYDNVMT